MKIWPQKKKALQRIIIGLLLITAVAFFLLMILFFKIKNCQQQPCMNTFRLAFDPQASPCFQKVARSEWQLKNDQIRLFPRCLTVMNSRLGSRFNLDWHFSTQQATSSVLGNLEDKDTHLSLLIRDGDEIQSLFPILSNNEFSQWVDLGLTYQKIGFENNDFLISLSITSPFSPSRSIEDENTKMSSAPFFYLTFSLTNKTNFPQTKTLRLSMSHAQEIETKDGLEILYLKDTVRGEGARALALSGKNEALTPFVKNKRGGFEWQIDLEPQSFQSMTLVYAGFLDQPVITDTSQPEKEKLKFAYTRWFKNIDEIIKYAWGNQKEFIEKTDQFEKIVQNHNLSPQAKWLMSQAFHSYLGNTWLVADEKNDQDLDYFVWEAHFKYLNTLDVAHDYAVLEGLYFPWVLKYELLSWQKAVNHDEAGAVIPHDVGHRFNFKNAQGYGVGDWQTSSMPVEENANFILLSHWYWRQTDDNEFIKNLSPFIKKLIDSLIARDTNDNGLADYLIGITTYDNDGNSALKEAPDSTYLGIKQLAAYSSAAEIFKFLSEEKNFQLASSQAELIANSLKTAYQNFGFIPLSLDDSFQEKNQFNGQTVYGRQEQGFVFANGLFYPALTNLGSRPIEELIPLLSNSFAQAYEKSLVKNQEGKIVGLQLAENQALGLGWFSHSLMADFIAQELFYQKYDSEKIFFPLLFDSPFAFADGQYFKEPFYPPQTTLGFYPRGAVLFAFLAD